MHRNASGFTLIELMITIAIIAIVAAVAIPNQLAARMSSNEASAIATLRNLAAAQAQFQSTSAIDGDSDGVGTYGGLGELAGVTALTIRDPFNASPFLDPPILSPFFANVDVQGRVARSGYLFQVFLPDGLYQGQPEGPEGTPHADWDEDACEFLWSAYAWPFDVGTSGSRAFYINHRGEIVETRMAATPYSAAAAPGAHAALSGPEMTSPLGIRGAVANDGNVWIIAN